MAPHGSYCRPCMNKIVRDWREKHKEYHRSYKRQYYMNNREALKEMSRLDRLNSPKRVKATTELNRAVRNGDIVKQPCEVCGDIEAEAHHNDYTKPLEVAWLCSRHHKRLHSKIKEEMIL